MDLDFPFKVEYVRINGGDKCKQCRKQFLQDELRIATMVQSKIRDDKDPVWYHKDCIFQAAVIRFVEEIENFEGINYDDQLSILQRINAGSAGTYEQIAKKRATEKPADPQAITNYGVEYSTSNTNLCYICKEEILRNEICIKKITQDSEIGQKFGKEIMWNHLHCFVLQRDFYGFSLSGVLLPGFESLQPTHQKFLKEALPSFATDEEVKTLFLDPMASKDKNSNDIDMDEVSDIDIEQSIAKQTEELTRVSQALHKVCSKDELQYFLVTNDSDVVNDYEQLLDRCADILTLGALYKCQQCFNGDMIFTKHGYTCNAMKDEWVKCGKFTTKPMRLKCVIPDDFRDKSFFATCDPTVSHRVVRKNTRTVNEDQASTSRAANTTKPKTKVKKIASLKFSTDGSAVDPKSGLDNQAQVYRHNGTLYSSVLGLTDIERNKNSYFKIQVLQSDARPDYFWLFTSWGRIGTEIGSSNVQAYTSAALACAQFGKIYEEQTGNAWGSNGFKKFPEKFYPVDINYNDDLEANTTIATTLTPQVEELVKLLFNVQNMKRAMLVFQLDLEKMPLGKLSVKQLQAAYYALAKLEADLNADCPRVEIIGLSNKFYTLIPHNFGLEKAPVLDTFKKINEKREIVDSLFDIENAYAMMTKGNQHKDLNTFDAYYNQLNAEIIPLDPTSQTFKLIETYARNSHPTFQRIEVFTVNRQGEKERFAQFEKFPNRQLLWHGSSVPNFTSILSKGLTTGQAAHGGLMFGRGIYFADMLCKSLPYCNRVPNAQKIICLALCEVALGTMQLAAQAANIQQLPLGTHSVKGTGLFIPDPNGTIIQSDGLIIPLGKQVQNLSRGTTAANGTLNYNEYIVYNDAQVKIRYLVKIG